MADKPAHIVEISEALGRDIDNGKLPEGGLPIEEVLHPQTVAQIHRQATAGSEPVRAENLIPISPAEAAMRRTQHGESLPSMPVARRVIPPPYRRDRVSGGQHGKVWQGVPAAELVPGDMTEAVGRIAGGGVIVARGRVHLTGIGGATKTLEATDLAQVFRPAPQ